MSDILSLNNNILSLNGEILKLPSIEPPPTFEFISVWSTTGSSETINLPLTSFGSYNFTVNWGDGSPNNTITTWNQAETSHTYTNPGTYTVTLDGLIDGFSFSSYPSISKKIIEIKKWGSLRLGTGSVGSVGFYFSNCSNLILTGVTDVPILSATTDLSGTFQNCTSITSINNLELWDTSNVTNMTSMFRNIPNFNQNINSWNVSNVTNMANIFNASTNFNQPLNNWNTAKVSNMSGMFNFTSFNQDISNWVTSAATDMNNLFASTPFNQNINNWNVSNVTNMGAMFANNTAFNQPLNNWSTSKVTNMISMFNGTSSFNQNIGNWVTSGVTNMSFMFRNAFAFNQNLSGWCVTLIPSKPTSFDLNVTGWVLPKPIWGTCPT